MAKNPEPWFAKAWQVFYDGWNFAQFLSATIFGAWVSQMTGIAWSTPLGPWLAVAAAILGGIALVRVLHRLSKWIRVVVDRPSTVVNVESSGTDKPMLEIVHAGAPVTFWAEGRVIRPNDANAVVKPSLGRFACHLLPPEGREAAQRLTLADGDWAHIVLADIVKTTADDKSWLRLRRGSFNQGSLAEDSGADMEVVIKTEPSWPEREIKRVVRITRSGNSINAVLVDD